MVATTMAKWCTAISDRIIGQTKADQELFFQIFQVPSFSKHERCRHREVVPCVRHSRMLTASVHQLCLAGICCSIVGWALSTTLVCYACREVTKCSIFNTKSSPPGAVSKWLRANGFNVGVCIIYFAKAEFYCALLFSASLATTCIATAWSVLFPDDAAIVEMKYFESASLLAGSSDRDVFVASAAFVIVAACGYFVFLMVLQYFRAGLGIIPFFVGSIGGVITKSIRWHIDTTWTFLTLRYFAVSDVDYLNDKRPLFESVDMVRLRYGVRKSPAIFILCKVVVIVDGFFMLVLRRNTKMNATIIYSQQSSATALGFCRLASALSSMSPQIASSDVRFVFRKAA